MHTRIAPLTVSVCLTLCNLGMFGQSANSAAIMPAATAKFSNGPNFPACGVGARQDGDANGPSIILIRLEAGCVLPWHWHTSNERIILISGSAKAQMKGAPPMTMEQGDFLLMSSKHIHQFTATTAVELYDISETTFDIHYVNAAGTEIPVATALELAKKTQGIPLDK